MTSIEESKGEPQSLSSCFAEAQSLRRELEATTESSATPAFQARLATCIARYEACVNLADRVSLFSPNESLEDIATLDLQYLILHFRIAELLFRATDGGAFGSRKQVLLRAREELEKFVKLLDNYDALSEADANLWERYLEDKDGFETAGTRDAVGRRQAKIRRFKEERALKEQFENIKRNPLALQNADETTRKIFTTQLAFSAHQAFQSFESIGQELSVLSLAPPTPATESSPADSRSNRSQNNTSYSERLDPPLSQLLANGKSGPILDKDGRPIRPFTLLDSRQRLQQGVFRPDHSLPTMTIDEYLDEERRRGGIIEGGGEQSLRKEAVDEDDIERADRETEKARAWDEFKEENPRGSGNTLNMG